jgi:integrase
MSRRKGQSPKVRVCKRANGEKYYFFQYWTDLPGQEERKRQTEVIGSTSQMTKSEAERKKLEFISKLVLNSSEYDIPSSRTFADAVSYYREVFAPRMLRASTFSVADMHLKAHLEPDWKDVPVEHIDIDSVNEWIWKKREQQLSWVTIKNILRTMQRVLSASAKDKKPPFSQSGLAIPERDKLQMEINNRRKVSFSWAQAKQIAEHLGKMETLRTARREQYAALFLLAAASGLRTSELFALKVNDLDFAVGTVRVEESSDQRSAGKIGPCKNVTAYRTVLLRDPEGRAAMRRLKRFLGPATDSQALVFHTKRGGPLRVNCVLIQGLHPALKALRLEKTGLHAFRRGCNRRWELSGLNPAVIRQQMGHTTAAMTARYTGEIPLEQVRSEFSTKFGSKEELLEKTEEMENTTAA